VVGVGPRAVAVGPGFEPDSMVAAVAVGIAAVPTIVAADSGSRVAAVVIVAARAAGVAGVAADVPRVVVAGTVLASTAAEVAEDTLAVLAPGSRAAIVGVAAPSRGSVGRLVPLGSPLMTRVRRALCGRCECAAICRGLSIAQTGPG